MVIDNLSVSKLIRMFYIMPTPQFLFILCVSVIMYLLIERLIKRFKYHNVVVIIGLIIYFLIVVLSTVIERSESSVSLGYCLIPFETYRRGIYENTEFFREAYMNVVIFVPFGLLYSSFDSKVVQRKLWIIVVFAFAFSSFVEVYQFISNTGYAEVDDVIHNTFGVIIGLLVFKLFNLLFDILSLKVKQNKQHKKE